MNSIRKIFLLGFLLTIALKMSAVYVKDMPITLTLPDKTELQCFVTGDEFVRNVHDKDGFSIVQNTNGYYYYAVLQNDSLIASIYKVGTVDPSTVGLVPGLSISQTKYNSIRKGVQSAVPRRISRVIGSTQTTGVVTNVVVYVRFKGDSEFPKTRKEYSLMLDNPSTTVTSVNGYYKEISYGKQAINSPQFPVCDSTVNLSYEDIYQRAYYSPYNATTNTIGYNDDSGSREQALVARALNAINSQIPSNLVVDNDGDGYVDNVTVVVRGNADGWGYLLWPHQWTLYLSSATLAGKQVGRYIFITENMYVQNTLCHEMFHVIGAPDLYHYTGNGIVPVGAWDIMESGTGHPLAYMKWKYSGQRWITSIPEITKSGTYSVKALTNSTQNCYKIKSPNSSSEFFTVEYRRISGLYEKSIPGTGLIITRINNYANGNGDGPPDEIYVVRPQGSIFSNGNIATAHFSNYVLRTAFNSTTNPRPFLSDGSDAGIDISNILLKGDSMLFTINLATTSNLKTTWTVSADSYESASAYSPPALVADNNSGTIWHTPWSANITSFPHWLLVNLGKQMNIRGFRYLPRQDMENGRIKDYDFYTSTDQISWSKAASGTFPNSAAPQVVTFAETNCRYIKLIGKNEVNGKAFASMAELDVLVTPPVLSRKKWSVLNVSSYETGKEATLAFDSVGSTFWSSRVTSPLTYPHELTIDMNDTCCLEGASFLPRQDGTTDGTIAKYEFYTSLDASNWKLVNSGQWANNTAEKKIVFDKTVCRYIRLKALSEVSNKYMATLAELMVFGSKSNDITAPQLPENLSVSRSTASTYAKLTWNKDLTDKSLLCYRAYAGDSLLGDVYNSYETSVKIDTTKNYTFKLIAIDGSGNKSDAAQVYFSGITGTNAILETVPLVYGTACKIIITNVPLSADIDIYNSLGQLVYSGKSVSNRSEISMKDKGLYVIKLKQQNAKLFCRKVLVL